MLLEIAIAQTFPVVLLAALPSECRVPWTDVAIDRRGLLAPIATFYHLALECWNAGRMEAAAVVLGHGGGVSIRQLTSAPESHPSRCPATAGSNSIKPIRAAEVQAPPVPGYDGDVSLWTVAAVDAAERDDALPCPDSPSGGQAALTDFGLPGVVLQAFAQLCADGFHRRASLYPLPTASSKTLTHAMASCCPNNGSGTTTVRPRTVAHRRW